MRGTPEHQEPLRRLGYDWLENLGGGGMAVVYKVRRRDNGRVFAAKAVSPAMLAQRRDVRLRLLDAFTAEASVWMSLSPNPDDVESDDERVRGYRNIAYADSNPRDTETGTQFLILQFVEGRTLDELLSQVRFLSVDQAIDFGIQFCKGMIYCQYKRGADFVHRDVKPSNMMVTRSRQLKIIDFGLSASVGHRSGLTVFDPGTHKYRSGSDEGDTPQRDVYAFGVTLAELVAGASWDAVSRGTLTRRQRIPEELREIIARCMMKRPTDRYPSFEPLKRDLESLRQLLRTRGKMEACSGCGYAPSPEAVAKGLRCPLCGGTVAGIEAVQTLDPETTPPLVSAIGEPPPRPPGKCGSEPTTAEEMVRIEAGTFTKGCDERMAERIVREFRLDPSNKKPLMKNRYEEKRIARDFSIGRCAVTNEAYGEFVADTGHPMPEGWREAREPPWGAGRGAHPVVGVSWHDAAAYCRWAGGRLPTADEWERSARGTDGRAYPWGDRFDPRRCNSAERGTKGTVPADDLPEGASPDGLLNTTGNVSEWTVPTCPFTGGLRGASFKDPCELFGLTVDTLRGAAVATVDSAVGFRVVLTAGGDPSERVTRRGMDFVLIPAGTFLCGCPPDRIAELDDIVGQFGAKLPTPKSRQIELPAFYIGKYPVTQEQYLAFVEERGWRRPQEWGRRRPFPSSEGDRPVVHVSYEDAIEFCAWMGPEFRLPDGLEWEKAARGGDGRFYPWGNRFDAARCHGRESGGRSPASVDSCPEGASPYGVHGLVGNVWEWVDDYAQLRGGSFRQTCEIYGLSAFVGEAQKGLERDDVGFRLSRDP